MTVDRDTGAVVEVAPWLPWLLWGGLTVVALAVVLLGALSVVYWLDVRRARREKRARARGVHRRGAA